MKRLILLVAVMSLSVIFFGCAGLQLNRTVDENNIFISTGKPKIKIKVNEPFQYRKQSSSSHSGGSFSGGEISTHEKREEFIFEDSKKEDRKLIFLVTSLSSSRWHYHPGNNKNMAGVMAPGVMTIGGLEYQYQTTFEINEDSQYIVKTLIRHVGTRNKCKFMIIFKEPVGGNSDENRVKSIDDLFFDAFEVL